MTANRCTLSCVMAESLLIKPRQAECAKAIKPVKTPAELFFEVSLQAGSVSESAMPRMLYDNTLLLVGCKTPRSRFIATYYRAQEIRHHHDQRLQVLLITMCISGSAIVRRKGAYSDLMAPLLSKLFCNFSQVYNVGHSQRCREHDDLSCLTET